MPLLDEWLWGGVMFMACCSLFWFIANKLHFTQNIPEKSQHSLKTTFIRWIFYVQCRFGEHVTFLTVLNSWTAGLPNRLRKEKAVSPCWADWRYHLPCPLCWLLLPQLLHRHAAGVVGVMGPVFLEGIWEREEGWEWILPVPSWPLKSAQSRPASLKYVKLLMI